MNGARVAVAVLCAAGVELRGPSRVGGVCPCNLMRATTLGASAPFTFGLAPQPTWFDRDVNTKDCSQPRPCPPYQHLTHYFLGVARGTQGMVQPHPPAPSYKRQPIS